MPKVDRNYSWTQLWDQMYRGTVKGLFAFGMNGVAHRAGFAKEYRGPEEGGFPGGGRNLYSGRDQRVLELAGNHGGGEEGDQYHGLPPAAAGFAEKMVHMTNSARWLQWKNIAVPPPGQRAPRSGHHRADFPESARPLYKPKEASFRSRSCTLTWPYTDPQHPSLAEVAKEINGKAIARCHRSQNAAGDQGRPATAGLCMAAATTAPLPAVTGSIAGSWTEAGAQLARRGTEDPSGLGAYPNWAWSWPANRRGARQSRVLRSPAGQPWDPTRKQIWWNEKTTALGRRGCARLQTRFPAERSHGAVHYDRGRRRPDLWASGGFCRWPLPGALRAHREPGGKCLCILNHSNNPVVKNLSTPPDKYGTTGQGFNVVCTTYRLTEHYHYWTKNNPDERRTHSRNRLSRSRWSWPGELGIRGGEKIKVTSARKYYIAKAFVTKRIKPHDDRRQEGLSDRPADQPRLPRHSGGRGKSRAHPRQPAYAHGGRPQRVYPGIQRLPGEGRKGRQP